MTARPLRVFLGMIAHETNSFSPLPTSLRAFRADVLYRGEGAAERAKALAFPGYGDLAAVAAQRGDELIEGLAAWTQPSGPATPATYQALRDGLLADLQAAGAVDMVLLNLHGAMLAEGCDDCESDIVQRARALVGLATPIGVLLDLHGNVGPAMLAAGAIVVACKEYPHTDYRPRAEELYAICAAAAAGQVRPRTLMKRVPVLELIGTTEQPMRGLVDDLTAREGQRGVLSASIMHGFPWADTQHAGACVLVVTDGSDPGGAEAVLDWAGRRFFEIATSSPTRRLGVEAAIDEAVVRSRSAGLIVIADGSDNPGGGAACDSTFLLRALLERRVDNAALGMIWDPQACEIAADAGVGARLPLRIGGKIGPMSGAPVDVEVEVLAVRDDARQRGLNGELTERLGLAVALRAGGVDIVLNSIRQQVFSTECFTELGIDLQSKALVVVKSIQHYRASFDKVAAASLSCNAPGSLDVNLQNLSYRHLRRPIWPLDGAAEVERQL